MEIIIIETKDHWGWKCKYKGLWYGSPIKKQPNNPLTREKVEEIARSKMAEYIRQLKRFEKEKGQPSSEEKRLVRKRKYLTGIEQTL